MAKFHVKVPCSCDNGYAYDMIEHSKCNGKGWYKGVLGSIISCSDCDGEGKIRSKGSKCEKCDGDGFTVRIGTASEYCRENGHDWEFTKSETVEDCHEEYSPGSWDFTTPSLSDVKKTYSTRKVDTYTCTRCESTKEE